MKQNFFILLACTLLISSCSSNITKNISKKYPPLDRYAEVAVLSLEEEIPAEAERIGVVYVDDSGDSKNCSWDDLIEKIKREARKAGGNTIKISKHTPAGTAGSVCHQITAQILKLTELPARAITRGNETPAAAPQHTLTPVDTVEEVYTTFRLAVNGGYSYRMASAPSGLEPVLENYINDLKSGYHFGGDATYFFTEKYGGGIKMYQSRASNSLSVISATDPNGNTFYGKMEDNIAVTFIGPSFTERYISSNRRNAFISSGSIGYLGYNNDATMIGDFTITGSTIGFWGDLGYEFGVSEELSIGLQVSYLIGSITEFEVNDGTRTQTIKAPDNSGESLNRFDFSIGIRFNK